eukprot:scaffold923_cov256-Pinguiococcus_pyrenoidosus.AAC.50
MSRQAFDTQLHQSTVSALPYRHDCKEPPAEGHDQRVADARNGRARRDAAHRQQAHQRELLAQSGDGQHADHHGLGGLDGLRERRGAPQERLVGEGCRTAP